MIRYKDSTWHSLIYLLYNSTNLSPGTMIECQVSLANTSYTQIEKERYKRGKDNLGTCKTRWG